MIKLGTNNIGKIYLGSNSIGKAYLGSNLVFQKGSQPVQLIPYIRGGADGSYIDTGITPDSTMRVIVWARNFNPGVQVNTVLFGSREEDYTTNTVQFVTGVTNYTGRMFARFGDGTPYWTGEDFNMFGHYHKYELRPNGIYIDDSLKASVSVPSTMSNNFSLFLFASNNAGTRGSNIESPIDICACKIYKNDVLVRDFTAVNSPSVGLYDAVSDTVFTNAGTGSFTYGSFNPDAYIPLDRIVVTKEQYFDAGIHATGDMSIVAKFRVTSTTANFKQLFGSRSNDTNMVDLMVGNESSANRYFDCRYNNSYHRIDAGSAQTNNDLVYVANGKDSYLYKGTSVVGSASGTTATFTSVQTIFVGAVNTNGAANLQYGFYGRIYYLGFGAERNFVPAKRNGVAGMYDTYNDVFYQSATSTPFMAGDEL